MKKSFCFMAAAVIAAGSASADLMLYDGFEVGGSGYTEGLLPGQSYKGAGFASGGSWSADNAGDSSVSRTGLVHIVASSGGRFVSTGDGGVFGTVAVPDLTASGPFGVTGLVDTASSSIGGGSVSNTLYYSFLARKAFSDSAVNHFAALELLRGGAEVLGVGNNWPASAYSIFGATGGQDVRRPSDNTYLIVTMDTRLFVVKITYNPGSNDDVTIWMDPNPADGDSQLNGVYQYTAKAVGDLSFDKIALRAGNGTSSWDFDEVRFGTSWEDVTPAPETDDLLSYEPFDGYNTGDMDGQGYRGTGYAPSGTWSGAVGGMFDTTTMVYKRDLSIGGKVTNDGGLTDPKAYLDTTLAGIFSRAGLLDHVGRMIGGGSVEGTLYVSFLARTHNAAPDAGESAFAGLEIYRGTARVQGLGGNNWGSWAYSIYQTTGDKDLKRASDNNSLQYDATMRKFVAKITYHAGAPDDLTVWMDPVQADGDNQGGAVYMYSATGVGDLSFDSYSIRAGNNTSLNKCDYDEIRFGKTFDGVFASLAPLKGTVIMIQ